MTVSQQIITVAILAVGTASTRIVPFLIFRGKETPKYIQYLSTVLPPAVFGMLVVYCLKDVQWTGETYGLPEMVGVVVTALLHAWKRDMLISVFGGTFL